MKLALVALIALFVLTTAAPVASAGPVDCPAVQPWWGICNAVARPVNDPVGYVKDLGDRLPP